MKSENLIIMGIWTFLITVVVGFFIFEIEITFFSYLVLFFLGALFSILVLYLPKK
jgi:hypothetical protein